MPVLLDNSLFHALNIFIVKTKLNSIFTNDL